MSGPTYSTIEMIERLVAFDTVSARSNLGLIDFVRDYLAGHGIDSRLTFDTRREKANLFATIEPQTGGSPGGGIVLSGHTDVVPVEGQPWDTDPFRVVVKDGRLYGRGTADMKSFIAIALALVPELRARDLKTPIHLALSYDEEIGCLGVPALLRDIADALPAPRLAIIGEPTLMRIANRHKGVLAFETRVTGRDGHSSGTHRGVNAVVHAAEIIGFLDRLATERRRQGPFDDGFDPPYTTLNIGTIEGGAALNIIPRHCAFKWEFRPVPADDPAAIPARLDSFVAETVLPRMRGTAPEADVTTTPRCAVPALLPEADSPAEALARSLTGANTTVGAAFATEAGLFQEAGIPAIVCGPGSIEQAHQPNEFIALEQVAACEAFLRRLADWAASG
ncbi:acetylornithine deacetylase [Virgifigura deserti]|uniref:acetylornithine deacetylase n=1 Tax=Virgifigura deserti TaxID=2268457 RepID=UPI003CCBC0BD